jgi:hypothetical protein
LLPIPARRSSRLAAAGPSTKEQHRRDFVDLDSAQIDAEEVPGMTDEQLTEMVLRIMRRELAEKQQQREPTD